MSLWGTGIVKGLIITMRNMMRGPITLQYPREKLVLPERARWAVQMKLTEEGDHKCTACLNCEKACPDYIIDIAVHSDEQRNKHIQHWRYEIGACMMCGLCVESCPFDAIEMGHDYELARFDPATLVVDLLHDTPAASAKRDRSAETAKPAAEAADAPNPVADVSTAAAPEPTEEADQ